MLFRSVSFFGDSVDMRLDGYHKVLPHDSIMGLLESTWKNMASYKIKMEDWESVVSADKKEEWVTVWYKQYSTDAKGKMDSVNNINDVKMVNGKIAVFDEKTQHYPAPVAKK